uniref:UPF0577 protein KIAA1324-like homolog n=1 Tax=Sinocyclocheilus rhinocerous TaxID=307959 RepID=A0A673NAP7_9TELE
AVNLAFVCSRPLKEQRTITDYYFEYTECDSTGSRWRVAIPHRQGSCSGLPEPVRGTDCTFSCEAGKFLEMSSQQCTSCAAGSYSLGSGVRFDQWDSIPAGFSNLATYMDSGGSGDDSMTCNNSSWTPQGSHLESNRDDCTVSLVYAVHLMKQGSVSFDYQYVDSNVFFEFFIQNDQCQEMDQTGSEKWIKLTSNGEWGTHTVNLKSGTNILYWRTTGMLLGGKPVKPVLLKNIQIEGVAYTSECFPCRPGTFSKTPGSSSCDLCPRNTYSGKGASSCTPYHDPYDCKCSMIRCTFVFVGWEVAGDHIRIGVGGSDNDYLILNLRVPGFKLPTSVNDASATEFGRITFIFETNCSADCELYFMIDVNRKSTNVVESWVGSKPRQAYTHTMTKNASVSYTWAFQRTNKASDTPTSARSARPTLSSLGITFMARRPVSPADLEARTTSALSSVGSIMNGPSFTSKGTKYYHQFNISLCGAEGRKVAVCTDNVTDLSSKDLQNESADLNNFVETFVCQSTIIPADGRGFRTSLSSQSISLADTFLGELISLTVFNIHDLFPESSWKVPDINFFYRSPQPTASCLNGRSTVVTLRCNPEKSARGELTVPSKCPAGTCNGCEFNFLWESSSACPLCTETYYHSIEGACKGGVQDTLYVWNEPKFCTKGVPLPNKTSAHCEVVSLWVKAGIGGGAFMAILLVSLTCYFWKKNKRLEYKYSRLVMSANKDCELPAADSCALAEGEGEENEDDVVYSNTPSLLGKLKAIATLIIKIHFLEHQIKY